MHDLGLIGERAEQAASHLEHCQLCPRKCGVNRLAGQVGFCGIGFRARVFSHGPHFGEEAALVGKKGSGAIFFSGCNLQCVFCQNFDISMAQKNGSVQGDELTSRELAAIMLQLQEQGCANINLVTPSHVVPQILAALQEAVSLGLHIPLVYNTSSYDRVKTLRLLDGIIQIYMPDCKVYSEDKAARYLQAKDYPSVMRAAVAEMHRQAGDLLCDERGQAVRGLVVRHLVMPGMAEETGAIMRFLAEKISPETFVNVMDQYHPGHRADDYPEINRCLESREFEQAMRVARKAGLHRFERRNIGRLLALLTR
ncbi:MAG TPA: radical SAM protein [Desulfobulbus sp.]|nr:radical SAM protein [Desulfobulbus sp.]